MKAMADEQNNKSFTVHKAFNNLSIKDLPMLTGFVEGMLTDILLSDMYFNDLLLASEEILSNILMYSHNGALNALKIQIKCCKETSILSLTFIDDGIEFNPLQYPPPNIELSIEERKIGGLGIHLVKHLTDHIMYSRLDGKNMLTIQKFIKPF